MTLSGHSSEGLVLRKLDYSETSLIFVLITKEYGKQSFLLKGARKLGKKKFPAVDLFRHVQISYRPHKSNSDLINANSAELLGSFDRLASFPNNFRTAIWIAHFVERNTVENDPTPQLFEAVRCAFLRLSMGKLDTCIPVWLGIVFSALDEHGMLPDLSEHPEHEEGMQYMLAYATDHELPPPEYSDDVWFRLAEWAIDFLDMVQLNVPDGLEQIS